MEPVQHPRSLPFLRYSGCPDDGGYGWKLDANESSQESKNEKQDGSRESRGDGMSLLDKMKTLLFKKEREGGSEEKVEEQTEQYKDGSDKRDSFYEYLRKDAPSLEEQVQKAKEIPVSYEYLASREKSERAERVYPDLKSWELSPEQLADVRKGVAQIAETMKTTVKKVEASSQSEGRTPGDDAWERLFERD